MRPGADRCTFQVFSGYQTDAFRWGVQYSNQDREDDPPLELASAFAVYPFTRRTSLIGRIDRIMEQSPKGNNISYLPFDPRSRSTFLIGGVEFRVTPHLSITPNVVFTKYDESDQGFTPRSDLYLRVAAFLNFE